MFIHRIVSGGQTGVDRAALDAAMAANMPVGGWCPKGRRAEDGVIDARYPLAETPRRSPLQRTRWNVRDSDATLILTDEVTPAGGTAETIHFAQRLRKPTLVIDPASSGAPAAILGWEATIRPGVLNIAGPRESKRPGVYAESLTLLNVVLPALVRKSDETTCGAADSSLNL